MQIRESPMFKGNGTGGDAVPEIDGILCDADFSDDRAYGCFLRVWH